MVKGQLSEKIEKHCIGKNHQKVVLRLMGMGVGIEGVTTPHLILLTPIIEGRAGGVLDFCSGNWSIGQSTFFKTNDRQTDTPISDPTCI